LLHDLTQHFHALFDVRRADGSEAQDQAAGAAA
jgi:hypothetical protein